MGDVVTETAVAYVQYSSTASRAYLQMVASINDNVTSDPTIATQGSFGVPTPFQ